MRPGGLRPGPGSALGPRPAFQRSPGSSRTDGLLLSPQDALGALCAHRGPRPGGHAASTSQSQAEAARQTISGEGRAREPRSSGRGVDGGPSHCLGGRGGLTTASGPSCSLAFNKQPGALLREPTVLPFISEMSPAGEEVKVRLGLGCPESSEGSSPMSS